MKDKERLLLFFDKYGMRERRWQEKVGHRRDEALSSSGA